MLSPVRPSVCLSVCRSVVCRLCVVCNASAPYSDGWNFRQYFCGIWYLGIPLTSAENFTEIVPGEPPRLGKKGVAKYSHFWPIEGYISETCKIGGKLVLTTNRKSHMGFRFVPKSVTLNDLERHNCRYCRYFTLFQRIRQLSGRTA